MPIPACGGSSWLPQRTQLYSTAQSTPSSVTTQGSRRTPPPALKHAVKNARSPSAPRWIAFGPMRSRKYPSGEKVLTTTGVPSKCAWISDRGAVAEIHDTIAEPALVQQLELGARVAGQRGLASTDEYGPDEELAPVAQPGLERVRRDVRAAQGQITRGRGFHVAD